MKKLFSLIIIFALLFSTQVIFAADVTGKRNTAVKVEYLSTQPLSYQQDSDIEIDKIRNNKEIFLLVDSSSAMREIPEKETSPFDYALFSGSETQDLILESTKVMITGDVHANKSIIQKASSITLKGKMEAVEDIIIEPGSGSIDDAYLDDNSSVIEMKDLSDKFKVASIKNSTYFSTAEIPSDKSKQWCDLIVNKGDGNILDKEFHGKNADGTLKYLSCSHYFDSAIGREKWNVSGDEIVLIKGKPLFFDGDVAFSVGKISGDGFIVATGKISFNSGSFDSKDIGIYSIEDDVKFSTGSVNLNGLIYTPNGTATVDSGNMTVKGCVVGKNIDSGTGKIDITYDGSLSSVKEMKSFEEVERTISVAKTSIEKFVKELKDKYAKSDVKVNIIKYNDKAEFVVSEPFNIATGDLNTFKTNYVNSIDLGSKGANLGDGLRLAYFGHKKSEDKTADKYIVVLAASDPNRWTKNDDLYSTEKFKLDNGEIAADSLIMDKSSDKATEDAIEYATKVAGLIKSSNIKTFFIDVNSGDTLGSLRTIATSAGAGDVFNPEAEPEKKEFGRALDDALVTNIAGTVMDDASYLTPKVTVSFTEKIPAKVDVIEYTDFNKVTDDGDLVLKNNDKVIVTDLAEENKVKVTLDDIKIKVKYNQLGTKTYPQITATYTITNPETSELVGYKNVDISKLDVEVVWTIDIN